MTISFAASTFVVERHAFPWIGPVTQLSNDKTDAHHFFILVQVVCSVREIVNDTNRNSRHCFRILPPGVTVDRKKVSQSLPQRRVALRFWIKIREHQLLEEIQIAQ